MFNCTLEYSCWVTSSKFHFRHRTNFKQSTFQSQDEARHSRLHTWVDSKPGPWWIDRGKYFGDMWNVSHNILCVGRCWIDHILVYSSCSSSSERASGGAWTAAEVFLQILTGLCCFMSMAATFWFGDLGVLSWWWPCVRSGLVGIGMLFVLISRAIDNVLLDHERLLYFDLGSRGKD